MEVPQALLVSWDDESVIRTFGALLEEKFGYHATYVTLSAENAEMVLTESLHNSLSIHSDRINPFILYLHGDSSDNTAQSKLYLSDALVILDCKHQVLRTKRKTYPILEHDRAPGSTNILQILVVPKDAKQPRASFSDVLTGTLRKMVHSPGSKVIEVKSLKAEISGLSGLLYPSELYDMRDNQNDLELRVCAPKPGPSVTRNREEHSSVFVLPITWSKVESIEAEAELEELIKVFQEHFDFTIEDTVKIPNDAGASSFLKNRIDQQIIKTEAEKNGLLIVLYNGHANRENDDMYLAGDKKGVHTVNWTEFTHKFNIAHCDVVHVLDCCYSLSATKTSEVKDEQEEMIEAANSKTRDVQFFGRNESLTAGGRQQMVPAGEESSMMVFATVLREMATQQPTTISIWEWQQHIIDKVGELMKGNHQRYAEPHYKVNPIRDQGKIELRVKWKR
ncbi:hypothetical protein FSARC_2771 [Fusarium sarcochroum]|uniref:Uncharacterized protein n=1 Tax=Fusarium sarcochroum TaxID=1208366 RepID=A0A8H4XDI1_9HYPO|nr:hypothetical protein FSARC_2771 [Fusarium sarcochroum]